MILTVLKVALGGAIGAALRYLSGVAVARLVGAGGFPLGVIFVNVLGSAVMGAAFVWLAHRGLTHWNAFLMTGVLGGFTTFSAFSLETFALWERGAVGQAAVYVALSVGLSLAALVGAIHLARGAIA